MHLLVRGDVVPQLRNEFSKSCSSPPEVNRYSAQSSSSSLGQ